MGLVVVGLALLDISVWFMILNKWVDAGSQQEKMSIITTTMLTFGMGASLQALFARVGGGIFTKAADVGADLVGKVEASIPEDDPRNAATIADNVGDNVGDVAGMGADLYESYCGSILATAALGAAAYSLGDANMQYKAVIAPMIIAAVGTLLSIVGVYAVRAKPGATQRQLMSALGRAVNISSILIVIASFGILKLLDMPNWIGIWGAIVTGLVTGECSSAALWPFAACKRRLVTRYSILLFHPMKWQSEENVGLGEAAEWARHFGQLEVEMDRLLAQLFKAPSLALTRWAAMSVGPTACLFS